MNTQKDIQINLATFFSEINTVEELQLFYKEIDQIISSVFQDSEGLEKVLSSVVSAGKKEKIISLLRASDVSFDNLVEVQKTLELIKEAGSLIPQISLKLAFEPSQNMLRNIGLWFVRNLEQKVFLDIQTESNILGGAHIAYDGEFSDQTLKTKIDHLLSTKKYL